MKSNLHLNPEITLNTRTFISKPPPNSIGLIDTVLSVHLLPQSWVTAESGSCVPEEVRNLLQDIKSGKLYVNTHVVKSFMKVGDTYETPNMPILNIIYNDNDFVGVTEAMAIFKNFGAWVMSTLFVDGKQPDKQARSEEN